MSTTIFALASGVGRAGIAVWRLSGPQCGAVLASMTGRQIQPRHATYCSIKSGDGAVIDRGLVLLFPAPQSFTGEDMAELQIHGGRAMARAISDALIAMGLTPALPGDFTRRAVLNGKLDLTAAEAIMDLVDADTDRQRLLALNQAQGKLARQVDNWRTDLIRAAGYLEATIDFAEEDIPPDLLARVQTQVADLAAQITAALQASDGGERLRQGFSVVILGAPNAGKSSLLNQIAGRDVAIVSHVAGTTRDVIEVDLDLEGWPVILSDTAGLRDAVDEVEQEGIRRAQAIAERADLKLVVLDGGKLPHLDEVSLGLIDERCLVVINKLDQAVSVPPFIFDYPVYAVCAKSGQGIDNLLVALASCAESAMSGQGAVFNRARHRSALIEAVQAMQRFDLSLGVELAAEDLRLAATAIGRITGQVLADDLLDVVFREFCIGK